jgi:hypothetical protein
MGIRGYRNELDTLPRGSILHAIARSKKHAASSLGIGLALMLNGVQITWSMETVRTLKSSPHLLSWVIPFHALQALLGGTRHYSVT